jgi:tripartite-type tricarboxylate transporter receptor subunit TctC
VFSKLPYDPERDFKPVANLYSQIEGLMVAANVPATTASELRAIAVAKPGSLNFGTLGQGTGPDLFRQWLGDGWSTQFAGIPYKGGNLIITALVAGEVDLAWIGAYNAIGQQKAGKIRFLAVGSSKRLRPIPNVPTIDELGLGEKPLSPWVAWGGPAGMPDSVVNRLNGELHRVFAEAKFVDYMEAQYIESLIGTPQELAAFMRKDREAFGRLVKKYNVPRQ